MNKEHIFTIIAKNQREILLKGKSTIFILNSIISLFIFILLFLLYKNQRIMQRYNLSLKTKIKSKTEQLEETLLELKIKNKELYKISRLDSLTNIKNRRSFFIEGNEALSQSIKNNTELSVVLIDIDHFKNINDKYGHGVGDAVLRKFCDIINSMIDTSVIFGRIGGEEFGLIFRNSNIDDTEKVAERIRNKIEKSILNINGKDIIFTISLGLVSKKNYQNIDELLVLADEFLYKAKRNGRNRLIREKIRESD